jgi:hypothetical protein
MEERRSASACLADETCLPDGAMANERKGSVGRMGLAFPTVHDVSVPERRACVARFMHWGAQRLVARGRRRREANVL